MKGKTKAEWLIIKHSEHAAAQRLGGAPGRGAWAGHQGRTGEGAHIVRWQGTSQRAVQGDFWPT